MTEYVRICQSKNDVYRHIIASSSDCKMRQAQLRVCNHLEITAGIMMAFVLIIVGVLQIAAAALALVAAKSNIHEIYAAILFTGGVLELGLAVVLMKLTKAVDVGREISAHLGAVRQRKRAAQP